jgi:hypothetical protein
VEDIIILRNSTRRRRWCARGLRLGCEACMHWNLDCTQGFFSFCHFHGLFYITLPDHSVDPSPEMLLLPFVLPLCMLSLLVSLQTLMYIDIRRFSKTHFCSRFARCESDLHPERLETIRTIAREQSHHFTLYQNSREKITNRIGKIQIFDSRLQLRI